MKLTLPNGWVLEGTAEEMDAIMFVEEAKEATPKEPNTEVWTEFPAPFIVPGNYIEVRGMRYFTHGKKYKVIGIHSQPEQYVVENNKKQLVKLKNILNSGIVAAYRKVT